MTSAEFVKSSGFRRLRRANCSAAGRAPLRNTKAVRSTRLLPLIDSDGSKPFEVTGQHVSVLSERKLVNLMRRLLSAEAHNGELPLNGIHVAAVVTAPDGGEDAKIEWRDGPERTKFLPARCSQFQLKASDLSPADAGGEVVTAKGEVKPMVRAALDAGGTYILVCGQSYTNSKLILRENAIRKALAGAGTSFRDEQIKFRDADQIAMWVNAPSACCRVATRTNTTGPRRRLVALVGSLRFHPLDSGQASRRCQESASASDFRASGRCARARTVRVRQVASRSRSARSNGGRGKTKYASPQRLGPLSC
jgi:hypothetical protein